MILIDNCLTTAAPGIDLKDRPILLPFNLESYDGTYVTSPGRPGIPASVPAWSQAMKKNIWICSSRI